MGDTGHVPHLPWALAGTRGAVGQGGTLSLVGGARAVERAQDLSFPPHVTEGNSGALAVWGRPLPAVPHARADGSGQGERPSGWRFCRHSVCLVFVLQESISRCD